MAKCSPHTWNLPLVGDDGLTCITCGRYLDFMGDITPNIRASIVNGVERRLGRDAARTFSDRFTRADNHCLARLQGETPLPEPIYDCCPGEADTALWGRTG